MRAVCLFALGVFVLGAASANAAGEIDLRVYTESYPPYSYLDKSGRVDGLSTRIVRKILDESGLQYQIALVPWTRAYRVVLDQDNALIFTLAKVPEREALFRWLVPLGNVRFHLYARRDDTRYNTETNYTDGSFRVACLVDDISCSLVDSLGFPPRSIVRIAEMDRPDVQMVLADRADLYVAEEIYNLYRLKRLGLDPDSTRKVKQLDAQGNLYLAGNAAFRQDLAAAILAARERLLAKGENLLLDAGKVSELPE